MNELFPVACGILIGLACSERDASRWRRWLWIVLSILCGGAATVLSGEFKIGWEFLLIDIPLVAVSALIVMGLRKHFRRAARGP